MNKSQRKAAAKAKRYRSRGCPHGCRVCREMEPGSKRPWMTRRKQEMASSASIRTIVACSGEPPIWWGPDPMPAGFIRLAC